MRTKIRIGTSAAVVALLVTLPAGAAVAARHAGPTAPVARYVTVAGNAQYLVYTEAARVNPIRPQSFNAGVELYLLRKHGGPVRLGPVGRAAQLFSLSRSNFIVVNVKSDGNHVQSWNLATGHHQDDVTSEDVVGAAPDGWLFEAQHADGDHVFSQSYSGDLVDLGVPVAKGVDYGVTSGPNGFVAFANNFENENGQITYTSWSHPSRHRTLLTWKHQNNSCASLTSSFAACVLSGGKALALLPLDGSQARLSSEPCARTYTVWGSGIGFVAAGSPATCHPGHVGRLALGGSVTYSKQTYSNLDVVSAWGRLVVSTHVQHALVTLTSARAKPVPLRRASVS